jgi:predicted GIY-YIG superfamily endonuclease
MPCTKCRQTGHNSRTCKNEVLTQALELAQESIDLVVLEPSRESVPNQEPTKTKKSKEPKETKYYCYILGQSKQLQKGTGKTYNGYTVNLNRRLRQHNGEIKGGAYATRGIGPWEFIAVMTCDSWTNVRAMQVEWLIRYPTRKKPRPTSYAGARGRISSLVEICKRLDDDSVRLYIHPTFYDYACGLGLAPPLTNQFCEICN